MKADKRAESGEWTVFTGSRPFLAYGKQPALSLIQTSLCPGYDKAAFLEKSLRAIAI